MAKEVVKEFETVEKQREVTICDNCGVTEEEKTIVPVGINPQVEEKSTEQWDVVEVYDDKAFAEAEIRSKKKTQIPRGLQNLERGWGVGMRRNRDVKNARVSAKTELCVGCIDTILNVDIPEDEEVSDIEFEDGGVAINTTKEITTIWPQIHHERWSDSRVVDGGWKLKIIGWPIFAVLTTAEYWAGAPFANMDRVKGYIGGSIGAIIWTAITMLTAFMTGALVLM